jgi:hypothetical protein
MSPLNLTPGDKILLGIVLSFVLLFVAGSIYVIASCMSAYP